MTEFFNFPAGFAWGSATAAYQVEGAVHEDGRTDSIWDVFARTPGKILNGDTGDTACDHYHRWKEDVALMKQLGLKAYRFSLAWPRILPEGRGRVNQAGLDFYSRLVDELLQAGIRPMATLYHWDLPASVKNGWLERSTADAFAELTSVCARKLGDRVKDWVTINEPWCASILSYSIGEHAPGLHDRYSGLRAGHHLLLAHGLAVPIIRQTCPDARVGIALNLGPQYTTSTTLADRHALRHADGAFNRWFLDPIHGRGYPNDILADYVRMGVLPSAEPDFVRPGDFDLFAAATDFLAINYYSRGVVKAADPQHFDPAAIHHQPAPADNRTDIGWEIFPFGLYEIISRVYWEYKPAEIIISENGASYSDGPGADGKVHDDRRIAYLQSHLAAVGRAIQSGVPVTGYYQWSLMDNFEWAFGYTQRFGMVYVDFDSLKRIPKESAYWYQNVIQRNGLDA